VRQTRAHSQRHGVALRRIDGGRPLSGEPEIRAFGDILIAVWPGSKIVCEFARFSEHRDTLNAELTVTNEVGALHWSRINLASATGRREVIRALEEIHPIDGWRGMLDRACQLIALYRRRGEPAVALEARPRTQDRWLIPLLVPVHETTVLYGTGGSAKSLLALAIAVSGILGHPISPAWTVAPLTKVLYLDWETDRRAHEERLHALTMHVEAIPHGSLLHRRMRRPLTEDIETIRYHVDKDGIGLVIVDSLALAAGPEPEGTDAAVRTLEALNTVNSTRLVIAHISKAGLEQGQPRPFGSIFVENIPRSTILAQREEDGQADQVAVTFHHRKHNLSAQAPMSALTFRFAPDESITIRRSEPNMENASAAAQILAELRYGPKTGTAIAEATGIGLATVKKNLQRLEKRDSVIRLCPDKSGRGNEQQWGRRDTKRDSA
jgi:AAA domain-containing protein